MNHELNDGRWRKAPPRGRWLAVAATAAMGIGAGSAVADPAVCAHSVAEVDFGLPGDLRGTGNVNVADALCATLLSLQWPAIAAETVPPPGCLAGSVMRADLNCDESVDVLDLLLVVHLAVSGQFPATADPAGVGCHAACTPASQAPEYPFRMTAAYVPYGANYHQACVDEFGPEWSIADWQDLKDMYAAGTDMWELVYGAGFDQVTSAWLERSGTSTHTSTRDYFASFHNHNKPGSYAAFDDINNYFFSLGSWYGSRPSLCRYDG